MPTPRLDIAELLDEGHCQAEVARRLGISKATVCRHAKLLGRPPDPRFRRRHDWAEVQRYYDEGHTIARCIERFGFSRQTWQAARLRGEIVTRPNGMPITELLAGRRNRQHVKARLVRRGLKEDRCEGCGLTAWLGAPITIVLHHVNGDRHDNRLDNLELLCPNCHSQTENFAGRNVRRSAA